MTVYRQLHSYRRHVRFYFYVVMVLGVFLSGCVSQSSIEDDAPTTEEGQVFIPSSPSPEPPSPDDAVNTMPSRAVQNMIDESTKLLSRGEWESAIAMAERGMRIDRRVPELYLVIAEGYAGLQDSTRARQFAQQGLLYINSNSSYDVVNGLKRLRD